MLPSAIFTRTDWTWLFGSYLVNGIVFMTTGLLAWALRPESPLTRAFLAFAASWSVFLLTAMDVYRPATFLHLYLLANTFVWASGFELALLFPEPHAWARYRFAGYPLALAVFAGYEATLATPDRSTTIFALSSAALGVVALFFGGRLVGAWRQGSSTLARQRVRVVAIGTLIGFSVPGLLTIASVGWRGTIAQNLMLFAVPIFPLSLGYAIAKHDFFAIDAMVKRGATYAALSGAVGVVYVLAAYLFDRLLRGGVPSAVLPLCFILAVLLFFNPLYARARALVDRVFFRTRYDGAALLAEITADLASARHAADIATRVCAGIDAAIQTTSGAHLWRWGDAPAAAHLGLDAPDAAALCDDLAADRIRTRFDPLETFTDATRAAAVGRALDGLGVEIAVPMHVHGALVGMLGVGAKRSGLFFTAGDAEFLRALAQATAIALDNAHAYESLEYLNQELEARVKAQASQLVQAEHLATLGRLAAGVAHEINNPVSFIATSIEPLRERLAAVAALAPAAAKPDLDDLEELVGVMARGAERTAAIVRDLRSFSRVNEARRKAIDLHEAIDVTLRLLEPRWRDRITIARDYGPLPPIECDPGPINQVLMNLLANACDAIRDRGTIHVTTRPDGDTVTLVLTDDGCGIAPEHLARVFEPFFTTKDVGQGTGLGLAIVHGIVANHQGTITIESAVDRGTTVRLRLPIAAPAALAAVDLHGRGTGGT